MRLIVSPDSKMTLRARVEPALLKAVARAHDWYARILAGEASGPASIAQRTGFNERYVSKVLQCAFVAPDIVEAILQGRQPPNLTFKKLSDNLPMSWIEQRKKLGMAL
jgi:site-specific DNA recombinase